MLYINNALGHLKFLKNKPTVIFRIAGGFFNKLVLQKNVLRTIDIAINYDCHFKCKFCSASSLRDKNKQYLTTEEIKSLIGEAQSLGAIHMNFTGGEPLLRDVNELCDIIRSIHPKKMLVSLVTNGLFCTEESVKKLKNAGLDTLQLSIESIEPKKHDRLRGVAGSWEKAMNVAAYAKKIGLNVCLNMVLFKDNLEEAEKLARLCKEKGYFLTLNIASSVGNWKANNKHKIDNELLPLLNKFLKQSHIRNDTSWNFNFRQGCPGGTERVYITAYGDVLTCPLVHVSYGNILREPLKTIHERMNSFNFIKDWKPFCKHAFDKDYYNNVCLPTEKEKTPPLQINSLRIKI